MLKTRSILQPANWMLLFAFLSFVIPALIAILVTGEVPGIGSLDFYGSMQAISGASGMIFLFILVSYLISRIFIELTRNSHFNQKLRMVPRSHITVGMLMFVAGALPTAYLAMSFDGDTRSTIVSSLSGRVAYALSFLFISGFIILAVSFIERRRFVALVLITLVFSSLLLLLGGRGRIVWPIVGIFASWMCSRTDVFPLSRLLSFLLPTFFISAALDPIISVYYGRIQFSDVNFSISSTLEEVFILRRNFDGFYNFFTIYFHDEIPRSFSYIFEGPRIAFMSTYFPQVLAAGFSFPATLPGTFWMVGGSLGILTGAVFFGVLLGLFSTVYFRTVYSHYLALQFYLVILIFNSGSSLFDNIGKILAVIVMSSVPVFLTRLTRAFS